MSRVASIHCNSRIDANVDEANQHIEGAHTELLKYLRSVTSNRWLIIKVFGVLIFFFLIFIVFFAWMHSIHYSKKKFPFVVKQRNHQQHPIHQCSCLPYVHCCIQTWERRGTKEWKTSMKKHEADFLIIFVFLLLLHLFINNVRIPTRDSIKIQLKPVSVSIGNGRFLSKRGGSLVTLRRIRRQKYYLHNRHWCRQYHDQSWLRLS